MLDSGQYVVVPGSCLLFSDAANQTPTTRSVTSYRYRKAEGDCTGTSVRYSHTGSDNRLRSVQARVWRRLAREALQVCVDVLYGW